MESTTISDYDLFKAAMFKYTDKFKEIQKEYSFTTEHVQKCYEVKGKYSEFNNFVVRSVYNACPENYCHILSLSTLGFKSSTNPKKTLILKYWSAGVNTKFETDFITVLTAILEDDKFSEEKIKPVPITDVPDNLIIQCTIDPLNLLMDKKLMKTCPDLVDKASSFNINVYNTRAPDSTFVGTDSTFKHFYYNSFINYVNQIRYGDYLSLKSVLDRIEEIKTLTLFATETTSPVVRAIISEEKEKLAEEERKKYSEEEARIAKESDDLAIMHAEITKRLEKLKVDTEAFSKKVRPT